MSNPIILTTGSRDEVDPDAEYVPEVYLEHDEKRSELHLIVGEEAAGMAEGVPLASFASIEARFERLERLEKILDALDKEGGSLVIRCDHNADDDVRDWTLMSMFGSEAEDSSMAGGSHIGHGDTLDECLASAVR